MKAIDVLILGAGESGTGAARLAKAKGLSCSVLDQGAIKPNFQELLAKENISFTEQFTFTDVAELPLASLVIKSPGIPMNNAIVQHYQSKGISVVDELEFAARHTKAKYISITGSNGKTTTTLLTYHLLKEAGLNVGLAGNIGQSMAAQVIEDNFEWFVLEVSSFQLDTIQTMAPEVAVITNISPDHLDRYNYNYELYIDSKFSIIKNQQAHQLFITSTDCEDVAKRLTNIQVLPKLSLFSLEEGSKETVSARVEGNALHFKLTNIQKEEVEAKIPLEVLPIQGEHNIRNAMAAILIALRVGINQEAILKALPKFKNAPHRLEFVAEINGVQYINDSKATNVDSVKYALPAFSPKPIVWIAGGVDKGNDYSLIDSEVKANVKALIILGPYKEALLKHFTGIIPQIVEASDLSSALEAAKTLATVGDIVMLSPACASFDLFKNYEDRGDKFKAKVLEMKAEKE